MSSNSSIKERAKRKIKYNYWHSVIISFLFVIIVSGGYKYNSFISDSFSSIGNDILSKLIFKLNMLLIFVIKKFVYLKNNNKIIGINNIIVNLLLSFSINIPPI